MFNWIFAKNKKTRVKNRSIIKRHGYHWQPKRYRLKRGLPNVQRGSIFQQSYQSDNIYFYGIPIDSRKSEIDQVGIIEFEAKDVENNPNWFVKFT